MINSKSDIIKKREVLLLSKRKQRFTRFTEEEINFLYGISKNSFMFGKIKIKQKNKNYITKIKKEVKVNARSNKPDSTNSSNKSNTTTNQSGGNNKQ